MYSDLLPVVIIGQLLWLAGLSGLIYWIVVRFGKLGKGVKGGNLMRVLEKVLESERVGRKEISGLKEELNKFREEMVWHVQRVGLVRFNPFNETGGDQSFSVCLLDEKGDGVVLSCLHARDRTRMYAKPIKKGKGQYELSKEEMKAISEALKTRKKND